MRLLLICGVLCIIQSLPVTAITVTDFEGRSVSINVRPERIISLAPIATRVIAQFGLLDRVVGLDQKSLTMDLLPNSISERAFSIIDLGNARAVNEEAILRLRPNLIITQYDKAQGDRLSSRIGVPVLCIQNRNGMDYELFEILGKALFAEARANEIIAYMKSISAQAENFARNKDTPPPPQGICGNRYFLVEYIPARSYRYDMWRNKYCSRNHHDELLGRSRS
jgi:ABC-type Fe3+-hydroxamate transport system substrate-binding protein